MNWRFMAGLFGFSVVLAVGNGLWPGPYGLADWELWAQSFVFVVAAEIYHMGRGSEKVEG